MDIEVDYKPRNWARGFHASYARWAALVLHRRAGKSTAVLNHHQRAATDDAWERKRLQHVAPDHLTEPELKGLLKHRLYAHILPTLKQAKLTNWTMLKEYASVIPGCKVNESELYVRYPNGSTLQLWGADNIDALRGTALSGVSFDEYSQHPPGIFSEVISKSLADHLGYAIFCGTIKGKNQLYQAYKAGEGDDEWFSLWQDIDESIKTEDNLTSRLLQQAMFDDQGLIAKGLMTQEEFDQEWYLSVEAAIHGAYYARQLAAARKEGRIARVPYDPQLPVDTDWDLGIDDLMAIWFSQSLKSGEVRLIDYEQDTGQGLPYYAKLLHAKPYVYGQHWGPHDIRVRELGTGKSRLEVAKALGITFQVTPDIGVMDGIEAGRLLLPRCYIDAEKCSGGIEALTHYRQSFNERLREFTGKPVHDWSSHGADAFRGLAVRHKPPRARESRHRQPFERPMTGDHGWMA